jgi:hypothetical protein
LVSVAGVKKGKKVLDNNQEAIQLEWVIFWIEVLQISFMETKTSNLNK